MKETAKDIMTRKVIVVKKDMRVNDLIELFLKNKISCAPVVDRKKKLVGIVKKQIYLAALWTLISILL